MTKQFEPFHATDTLIFSFKEVCKKAGGKLKETENLIKLPDLSCKLEKAEITLKPSIHLNAIKFDTDGGIAEIQEGAELLSFDFRRGNIIAETDEGDKIELSKSGAITFNSPSSILFGGILP